jgi:hypothetical protein
MMKLIKQIFLESNFICEDQLIKSPNENYQGFFAKRLSLGKFDFFLVLSVKEDNLILEEFDTIMSRFLEQILSTQEYPGVDKNLSMLIIVERNINTSTDEFNNKIYTLEENPYYFKKYVLPYTEEQFTLLKHYINIDKKIIEQLDLIVNNKGWFSLFKAQQTEQYETHEAKVFDLVSKLYIKLPFLKIQINKEELPNLTKEIEDEISTEDQEVIKKILSIKSKDPKWEDILLALGVELDEI